MDYYIIPKKLIDPLGKLLNTFGIVIVSFPKYFSHFKIINMIATQYFLKTHYTYTIKSIALVVNHEY